MAMILYEDGNLRVLSSDNNKFNVHIKTKFESSKVETQENGDTEKMEKLISKDMPSGKIKQTTICVAISTNLNRIYICKDFVSLLNSMLNSNRAPVVTQETNLNENDEANIYLNPDDIKKYFDHIPINIFSDLT